MTSENVVRPLGYGEMLSSSRHSLGIYRKLANTCRYKVPQNLTKQLEDTIELALALVVLRQACLRVGIADESSNKPYFTRIDQIDLRDHLRWTKARHDIDLLHVLEEEQVQLWPDVANRPPWLVIVVETPEQDTRDIIFLVHHSLCDGRSAANFHKHLLQALKEGYTPLSEPRDHILRLPKQISMVPAMEEMIKFVISWSFLFKTLWKELGPKMLQRKTIPSWTGASVKLEPHILHLRKIEIDPNTTIRLVSACRAERSTLTGLIHALLWLSFCRRILSEDGQAFRSTTPIALAGIAKPPEDTNLDQRLFNCVTGLNHEFTAEKTALLRLVAGRKDMMTRIWPLVWEQARDVRKELKDRVDTLPKDDAIGLLNWVSDWQTFWTKKFGQPRSMSWEVSNIGSIEFGHTQDQDDWTIDRSLFSQPVAVTGAALSVNVAGVKNGILSLVFAWQHTIVKDELAIGVVKDLKTWLAYLANSS